MAIFRSPTQRPTSNPALEAMRRTGAVPGQMANTTGLAPMTPTPAVPGIFGQATTTPTTAANAAIRNIGTLAGPNVGTAAGRQVNPGAHRMNTPGAAGATPDAATASGAGANAGADGGATAGGGMPTVTAATVDTSKTDALYADQLAQSDKDRALMQQVGLNTISGLQTRNASNAARMGLQAGGASYLSGQRSAAIQGTNAFNQGLQQWGNQRQGIMSGQAGILGGAANTNAGNAQQAGIANTGRLWDVDDRATDAQSKMDANQNIGSADQINTDFSYLFNDKNFKDGSGQYNSLFTAYKNALSTGSEQEKAAAYQALMNYITPVQQARQRWIDGGGKDKLGDFQDWYKKYGGK